MILQLILYDKLISLLPIQYVLVLTLSQFIKYTCGFNKRCECLIYYVDFSKDQGLFINLELKKGRNDLDLERSSH